MTSKNLFFKLQIEDLKRRIWSIALSMLAFFICLTLFCALRMDEYTKQIINYPDDIEYINNQILELVSMGSGLTVFLTVLFAVVCGLSGFFYVHSRKKMDFYHSIPVRREMLFAFSYINGVLIYIVPYVINLILSIIILQISNFLTGEILVAAIVGLGINVLFYLLIYTITVIAVMLTGNFVISFLGTAVLLCYGPFLMGIKQLYYTDFFATYYTDYSVERRIITFLSPVGTYTNVLNKYLYNTNEGILLNIATVIIITILLLACAVLLYKKRPSEAAGNAMVYRYSKPIIKFLLVIPASLMGGILFREISSFNSNGWFWFGLIFTLILSYAIIEIIYNFEFKSAFRYKKQLLACAAIIAVTGCIFQFDLLQFDAYIPKKDQVKSMSVAIGNLDRHVNYYDRNLEHPYTHATTYQLKYMELRDFSSAYELAKSGAENNNILDPYNSYRNTFEYCVKYTLNSGRVVYRRYNLNMADSYELVNDIYEKSEFKEVHFPIYQYTGEDIKSVSVSNMKQRVDMSLNGAEKQQLLELYKEELRGLTLDEIAATYPVAEIYLTYEDYGSDMYYVYPEFRNTIAFLKNHGFNTEEVLKPEDIKNMYIYNYNYNRYEEVAMDGNNVMIEKAVMEGKYVTKEYTTGISKEPGTVTYHDPEKIKEIYPLLIRDEYYRNNGFVYHIEEGVEVNVTVKRDEFGNEDYYQFYFEKDKIPEYVKKDIGY